MAHRQIWELEVKHEGLNKYRHIRGVDKYVVEQKALAQKLVWDEIWGKKLEINEVNRIKQLAWRNKEENIEEATNKTNTARACFRSLEEILAQTFEINDAIVWEKLYDTSQYSKKKPQEPYALTLSEPPKESDSKYVPPVSFLDRLFPKLRTEKKRIANEVFSKDYTNWLDIKNKSEINKKLAEIKWVESVNDWLQEKEKFELEQKLNNAKIIDRKSAYLAKNSDAIIDYSDIVLTNSSYPECLSPDWNLSYQADAKIIVVDYSLPSLEDLPKLKSVKYVATRDEFVESFITSSALNELYDDVIYQIALRTIHELFEADIANALSAVVFNGWVNFVEKSTGRDSNACIISVQAEKDEFLAINLERVDPKACFKLLKGVGSSKLHGLIAVAPIISINKQDKRFVTAYSVTDNIDESVNLAAIGWQDFENLIRELFEKEFSSNGGEVKITQASRDGGVDAVAFDPDPIRGGKIVIQAKRYTNVVGVSAVRDLYGTTMNEGATKGILVTTANFGPDAYEFAKGKPLTLLNGSNLLHLLERHRHKAKIDLKAAKAVLYAEKN